MHRLAAILLLLLALSGCTSVFFQPHGMRLATPDQIGLAYEQIDFKAVDGTSLVAWFLPARGAPRATVLFLHGNADNISTHFRSVAWMPAAGFNVLALDYRGYGASQGHPTLAGVQLDIDAAMQALLARADVDPRRIVIFGQSLGGALAVHYVAHTTRRAQIRALVVDSAFSDYRRISREKLAASFVTWPFQWLAFLVIDNDYSPEASVSAISPIPLLLIHGDADPIVPAEHARRLYEAAAEPKDLWVVPGAGHIQSLGVPSAREGLTDFVARAVR